MENIENQLYLLNEKVKDNNNIINRRLDIIDRRVGCITMSQKNSELDERLDNIGIAMDKKMTDMEKAIHEIGRHFRFIDQRVASLEQSLANACNEDVSSSRETQSRNCSVSYVNGAQEFEPSEVNELRELGEESAQTGL